MIKKIKGLISLFNTTTDIYLGKQGGLQRGLIFIDFLRAFVCHGTSYNDYFRFNYPKLNHKGKKEFITLRRTRKFQRICNNDERIVDFRDKIRFNTIYSEHLGRKWLDVSNASFKEFDDFINSVGEYVFVKDVAGLCGNGVERIRPKDSKSKDLYNNLKSNPSARFLLEEPILQKGPVSELHPWSVNTIRITTFFDTVRNEVHVIGATLRMGTGKDHRDNFSTGGIAAHIDVETGIIFMPGFNKKNKTFIIHPDTGQQLVGFKIPDWEKCKAFIKEVAKKSPEVRYVGWDVVAKGDGSFLLIEGNDNGGHDIQQRFYKGLWPKYQELLKLIK